MIVGIVFQDLKSAFSKYIESVVSFDPRPVLLGRIKICPTFDKEKRDSEIKRFVWSQLVSDKFRTKT